MHLRVRGWFLLEAVLALAILGLLLPGVTNLCVKTHQFFLNTVQNLVKERELEFVQNYLRQEFHSMSQFTVTAGTINTVSVDQVASQYVLKNGRIRIKTGNANFFDLNTRFQIQKWELQLERNNLLSIHLETERGPQNWKIFLPNVSH